MKRSVLIVIIDFFGMTLKKFRPASIGATAKNVKYIIQNNSDYLGHSNNKPREECEDVFTSLSAHVHKKISMPLGFMQLK